MHLYVIEASTMTYISVSYIVCVFAVKTMHFTDSSLLPSYTLYEKIAQPNDTAKSTSG